MWFNFKNLKKILNSCSKIVYWRSFLIFNKIDQIWKLDGVFFNKQFGYKFRFSRKLKQFLCDHDNYFIVQNLKEKFFKRYDNFFNFPFFFLYLLLFNNVDFIINNKYKNIIDKYKLLKKNYIISLQHYKFLSNKNSTVLYYSFLLYKNFYLSEQLLLYFDFYVWNYESFFFNFTKLEYFLKYFFLRKCSAKLKLKIWDDCQFTVDTQFVFFKEESKWLKNLEIFEEENALFFKKINLDKVYIIWDVYKSKVLNNRDNNFKFLYYKYKFLKGNLDFLEYKLNYLKNKKKLINFFLGVKNFNINLLKKKYIITNLTNIAPFMQNRINLLNLIYIRRKYFKALKKKKYFILNKPKNVLIDNKKIILYVFFILFFLKYWRIKFLLNNNEIYYLVKNKFSKNFILKKKIFANFKLIFILFFKIKSILKYNKLSINLQNFLFSFFFFYNLKYLSIFENIKGNLILKNLNIILNLEIIQIYNLKNLNESLMQYLLKVLSLQFMQDFDNKFTKRYDILNITLYLEYKKYWFIVYHKLLKTLFNLENVLLKNLNNLNFFFNNKLLLKKLHNMYSLFNLNIFSLEQYQKLLQQISKVIINFIKKKSKIKLNKYNKLKNKFNKYNKYNWNFSLLIFLKNKIKKFNLNLKKFSIISLFLNIDILKIFIKVFLFTKLKLSNNLISKNKLPLFLKISFNISKAFFYYLSKNFIKEKIKKLKKIIFVAFYFKLLSKFKYIKKILLRKNKNFKYYSLFLKKNFYKKNSYNIINNKRKKFNITDNSQKVLINILKFNIILKKLIISLYSLNLFINLEIILYNYFFFFFKKGILKDIALNAKTHFLATITFFDYKNDFNLPETNFTYIMQNEKVNFYFNERYKYNKNYFLLLKNLFYLEKLNLQLNNRLFFIIWAIILNKKKKLYVKLVLNDDMFILRMPYFDFYKNYNLTLFHFLREFYFIIQLGASYLNFLDNINEFKYMSNLKLLERKIKNINYNIESLNFYFRKIFFKLVLKKKNSNIKLNNKYKQIIYVNNLYIKNNLIKKKIFNLTIYPLNFNFIDNICLQCNCLCCNLTQGKKILHYQNLLKLNLINKNIFKFNFIFCKQCKNYKISLIENCSISVFFVFEDLIKYFIKKKKKKDYIYFNGKIYYCVFFNLTNYVFLEEIILVNLKLNNYYLFYFYYYFKNNHKFYYNINTNFLDLNFFYIFVYWWLLLLLAEFFKGNFILVVPEMVRLYNNTLKIQEEGAAIRKRIDALKQYQKKNRIKITKKIKKERKLYHLNRFFEAFKNVKD